MLKTCLSLVLFFTSALICAQDKGNYILIIENDSVRIDLNNEFKYTITSGKEVNFKLIQPDILTYADDMISFDHDNSLSVSNSVIDEDIEQCMVMQSTGNGFLVQKYKKINPAGFTRLMLDEITKESISYGYTSEETPFLKTLLSGQTIEGIQATLTYRGEKEIYTVATYGEKDKGVIVMTMSLSDNKTDHRIIDLFLETLQLK